MRLNQSADYGLAAILHLAQKHPKYRCSLVKISQETEIPEEFLRKIFQVLVKAEIVKSFKGKGGGVSLARSPRHISVFEVIEPLENNGFVRCLRAEHCPRSGSCKASHFWKTTQGQLFEILKKTSITELINHKQGKCEVNRKTEKQQNEKYEQHK